jgi:nicotinamide-nucleotide amidase
MSESLIAEKLGNVLDLGGEPQVAFLASEGIITIKFVTRAESPAAAEAELGPAVARAREALGDVVFGEDRDTLEVAAARRLDARGFTVAVAESCTGGLIGDRLTDVPGISRWFLEGVVAYGNASKTSRLGVSAELFDAVGAVSEEVARAMAEGVRRRAGADVGVGVTGIAGPTGGSPEKPVGTVHVAVAMPDRTVHRKLILRGPRRAIKCRAAAHALNMLRLELS